MIKAIRRLPHELKWLHATCWPKLGHLWHVGLRSTHVSSRVTSDLGHHVLHDWVLAGRHELEIVSQTFLVSQKCLDGFLVLGDESRLGEAVLLVLD